jgi:hypothetical protein
MNDVVIPYALAKKIRDALMRGAEYADDACNDCDTPYPGCRHEKVSDNFTELYYSLRSLLRVAEPQQKPIVEPEPKLIIEPEFDEGFR